MKKMLLLLSLALLVVLASYGGAAEKVTLPIAVFPDLDGAYEQCLPLFNSEYPDIEVIINSLGIDDHHAHIVTTIAAGTGAEDVVAVEIAYIAQFVAEGGLVDLAQAPYNATDYSHSITPYALKQATTTDGRLVAMPVDIAPACGFYRRDVFAENNIDINDIKTLEDLFAAGEIITKDTTGDGRNDHWLLADAASIYDMIIHSAPELYFDEDGNCQVNSDRFREAFTWAKRFHDAGLAGAIGAWSQEWFAGFQEGTVAYEPCGAWLGGHLEGWMAPETSGKWGVAPWPALHEGEEPMAGFWGGSYLAIPEQSQNKDAAWKFIEFIATNRDSQITAFKATNAFPSWMPAWDDPMFEEELEFFAGQKARLLWTDIAKAVPGVVTYKYDAIANSIIAAELGMVLHEDKDIDRALSDAQRQIERRIR